MPRRVRAFPRSSHEEISRPLNYWGANATNGYFQVAGDTGATTVLSSSLKRKLRFVSNLIKHKSLASNQPLKEHRAREQNRRDENSCYKGYEGIRQSSSGIRNECHFLHCEARHYAGCVPGQDKHGEKKCQVRKVSDPTNLGTTVLPEALRTQLPGQLTLLRFSMIPKGPHEASCTKDHCQQHQKQVDQEQSYKQRNVAFEAHRLKSDNLFFFHAFPLIQAALSESL